MIQEVAIPGAYSLTICAINSHRTMDFFKLNTLYSILQKKKKILNILSSKTPESNITSLFLNTENVKGPYKLRVVLSIYFLLY